MGSYDQGASLCLSPRRPEELSSPPGWYGHSHPEGITFYPEHFGPDTVRKRIGSRDWDREKDWEWKMNTGIGTRWGQGWVMG